MVRDRSFYLTMLKLSIPVALQGLAVILVGTADNIMVNTLGQASFNGVTMANSLTNFLNALLLGLAAGSTVLVSQYWGKRDEGHIRAVFGVVVRFAVIIALLGGLLFFLAPQRALLLVTNDADTIRLGSIYLRVVAFSFLFSALTAVFSSMLRCVELVTAPLVASLSAVLLNVVLNYVLIFGKLGLPAMGIRGAALATFLSRALECLIIGIYALCMQKRILLRIRDLFRLQKTMIVDYIRYGLPVALGDTQWALVGILKAAIIGRLGSDMMAANNVAENMLGLVMIFTNSLTTGACVLIGKSVGERDYAKTRQYSNTIQIMFAGVGVIMCSAVFLLRGQFVSLFGELEPYAQTLSMQLIAVGALTMLGTSYHAACFMGINRGAGDSMFVFIVDMICGWAIVLPLSYLAAFVWKLPLPIVFLFIRIDQTFKWIIAWIRLRGNRWIKNVTRA